MTFLEKFTLKLLATLLLYWCSCLNDIDNVENQRHYLLTFKLVDNQTSTAINKIRRQLWLLS